MILLYGAVVNTIYSRKKNEKEGMRLLIEFFLVSSAQDKWVGGQQKERSIRKQKAEEVTRSTIRKKFAWWTESVNKDRKGLVNSRVQ